MAEREELESREYNEAIHSRVMLTHLTLKNIFCERTLECYFQITVSIYIDYKFVHVMFCNTIQVFNLFTATL